MKKILLPTILFIILLTMTSCNNELPKEEKKEISNLPKKMFSDITDNDGQLSSKLEQNIEDLNLVDKLNPQKKNIPFENIVLCGNLGERVYFNNIKKNEYKLIYTITYSKVKSSSENIFATVETGVKIELKLKIDKKNELNNRKIKKNTKLEVGHYLIYSNLQKKDNKWVITNVSDDFDSSDNWYFYEDYLNRVV